MRKRRWDEEEREEESEKRKRRGGDKEEMMKKGVDVRRKQREGEGIMRWIWGRKSGDRSRERGCRERWNGTVEIQKEREAEREIKREGDRDRMREREAETGGEMETRDINW